MFERFHKVEGHADFLLQPESNGHSDSRCFRLWRWSGTSYVFPDGSLCSLNFYYDWPSFSLLNSSIHSSGIRSSPYLFFINHLSRFSGPKSVLHLMLLLQHCLTTLLGYEFSIDYRKTTEFE